MAIAVRGSGWAPLFDPTLFDTDFDTIVRRAFGPQRRVAGFVPAADVVRDGADVRRGRGSRGGVIDGRGAPSPPLVH